MIQRTLYQTIASACGAYHRCKERDENDEWAINWLSELTDIARNVLPRGSGIDCGTKIDVDRSSDEKIVLTMSFHHMDENGMYDGWTEHTVRVTPSFVGGFDLRISGRDRNGIKEYLYDVYRNALSMICEEDRDWHYPGDYDIRRTYFCGMGEGI